jgi:hypothetical protein
MKKFSWPSIVAIVVIFVGLSHEAWVSCGKRLAIGGEQAGSLPLATIESKLLANGYTTIEEIELEDGYYEVEGYMSDGSEFEIYVDPATGDIVTYNDEDDDDNDDDRGNQEEDD